MRSTARRVLPRGCGRYGGRANWEEFTEPQWLTVRDAPASYPF